MDDKKINLLYVAIEDTQLSIRAVDVKIGFIFALIFAPLVGLPEIIKLYQEIFCLYKYWPIQLTSIICFIAWCLSMFSLFRALRPISNPANNISGNVAGGVFYAGYLYELKIQNLFSIKHVRSNKTIEDEILILPSNDADLIKELMTEKMKVSLIRDLKIYFSNLCINLVCVWIIFGLFSWSFWLINKVQK